MNHEAIYALYPNVVTVDDGAGAFDANGNAVAIDQAAVAAWVDTNAYKSFRSAEYPAIGDQLDDLFKQGAFSPEMAAKLQAVKDKYPKE